MKKLAIFGYTPREEVIVNTVRRDDPCAEIALFSGIPNRALEERVDHVHGTTDADIRFLKEWGADLVVIGPDRFSTLGIKDRLTAAGIKAIGADSRQIEIETKRPYLRTAFPEVAQYCPPFEVFEKQDPEGVRSCLRNFGKYAIKYGGVYPHIGGGTKLSGLHLRDEEEGIQYAMTSIKESGSVVIEQQIDGIDFSVNALSARDGSIFYFPSNYCYKLRNEGNLGPNTSGTGSFAYSEVLPFLTPAQDERARNLCGEIVLRINHRDGAPLVSGLNLDFRLGNDGNLYFFEMNARFPGAGTLSTALDLTANPLMDLLDRAQNGSFYGAGRAGTRAPVSVGVFTYPECFPEDPASEVVVNIPKAGALPANINCYTGWVNVLGESQSERQVVLQNSTTQLFQTSGQTLEECRGVLYPVLDRLDREMEYRKDIGDLSVPFMQLSPNARSLSFDRFAIESMTRERLEMPGRRMI